MDIEDRIQVVPLGYEYERVKAPIHQLRADKVVLVRQTEATDHPAAFQTRLVEELEANERIELEVRWCDLFDLASSIRTIKQAIRDHADEDVYVNLATGSKLTAIAGMMACQVVDATPFYVAPEFRSESGDLEPPDEPQVTRIGDIYDVPVFQMEGPDDQQIRILEYLSETDGATKKDLIAFAEEHDLPFIANTTAESDEGRYRLLDTHIISPLEASEYLQIEKSGRTKVVSITPRGEDAVEIFSQ